MPDRPPIPNLAKAVFAVAILLNLVVVTGLSRAGVTMILLMLSNISACAAIYWIILRHFDNRLP